MVEDELAHTGEDFRLVSLDGLAVVHPPERQERERARADVTRPRNARIGSCGRVLRAGLVLGSLRGGELREDPHVCIDLRSEPADLGCNPQALRDPCP